MRNEGNVNDKVATKAPGNPASRKPTKVAALTENGPGVTSEMAKISAYSWFVNQLRWTTSFWIMGRMA